MTKASKVHVEDTVRVSKAPEFQVGDVVRLKSGGPRMTVVAKMEGGQLDCQWFSMSDDSTVRSQTFNRVALAIALVPRAPDREPPRNTMAADFDEL